MSAALLSMVIGLLSELVNLTTSSATITNILNALINLLPSIEKEYEAVAPAVQNIIAALKGSPAVTPAQLAVVQALDNKSDADFEAAVTAFNAANPTTPLPVAGA